MAQDAYPKSKIEHFALFGGINQKSSPYINNPTEFRDIVNSWHASIGKAILESWGLPEALQSAVEHQDELDLELDGDVTLTDVLIAAKLLSNNRQDAEHYPALRRLGVAAGDRALGVMDEYADELRGVRSSLSD